MERWSVSRCKIRRPGSEPVMPLKDQVTLQRLLPTALRGTGGSGGLWLSFTEAVRSPRA